MEAIVQPTFFCPFPSASHPHTDTIEHNLLAWVQRFDLMEAKQAQRRLQRLKYGALIGRAYPQGGLTEVQIIADWTTWLFVLDDLCDEAGLGHSPMELAQVHAAYLDILRGGPIPQVQGPSPHALADLYQRMRAVASPTCMQRFIGAVADYCHGNVWEAINRARQIVPDRRSYCAMRRFTGGLYIFFALIEMVEHIELPDAVRDHPIVQRMTDIANDVVCWCNDVISLEKELHSGDVHNLVLVLQHEQGSSLQVAVDRVAALCDAQVREFIQLEERLPTFGAAVDEALHRYVQGLRCWMRANLDWSAASNRYHPALEISWTGRVQELG